jgi:hypothetical protein
MITDEIKTRIEKFHELFSQIEDDYEDFDDEITRVSRMEPAEYFDFMERRSATEFGKLFYKEFHDFIINSVFPYYLNSDGLVRQEVIELFDKCFYARSKVWCLMNEYRWKLRHSVQEERTVLLHRILLFAILEEKSLDHYETGNILRGVWNEAKYYEMDPSIFFKEAAAIAGSRKVIFGRSAQEILEWYCDEYFA